MLAVKKEGVVLSITDNDFENESVCNPAIFQDGDTLHMFYRAVRKGNYSTIGYCRFKGPLEVVARNSQALLRPEFEYESHGIEDPRIVNIDGLFYLTFAAYDGVNALGALATSTDMIHFERHGIIVPQISYEEFSRMAECNAHLNAKYERFHVHNNIKNNPDKKMLLWDKNLIFFPRRINGKLHFLHRIKPDIQIASVNELKELDKGFWEDYFMHMQNHIVLSAE